MTKNIPKLPPYDQALLDEAMSGVTPLKHDYAFVKPMRREKNSPDKLPNIEPYPPYIALFSLSTLPHIAPEQYIQSRQKGLPLKQFNALKQGRLPIDRCIDLHGLNSDQAEQTLNHLLMQMQQMQLRVIKIIHGKGGYSPTQRVHLKSFIVQYLHHRSDILAFCSATPKDGGLGALYALLRRSKQRQNTQSPLAPSKIVEK